MQVKFLSSIIKMTIEGAQEQQAGGSNGGTAPFTEFVDMTLMPSTALVAASAEDSFLPTIEEIKDLLRANKIKEVRKYN